jgi:hypothetical protein
MMDTLMNKIRNFYSENPWKRGFIFPGIIFLSFFFFVEIYFKFLEAEGLIYLLFRIFSGLALIGSPLWVISGIIFSKKRTPYVVSLIIGAISVFLIMAFYASKKITVSKNSIIKSIHSSTLEYISAEIQKCKTGESKFMNNSQDCPATPAKAVTGAVATMTDKNPFDTSKNAVREFNDNKDDKDVGFISLSVSGASVVIRSCISKPCYDEKNRLQDIIEVQ